MGTGRDDGKRSWSSSPIRLQKEERNYYVMDNFGIQTLPDKPSKGSVLTPFATRTAHGVEFKDTKHRTNDTLSSFSSHFDHVDDEARVNSRKAACSRKYKK